MSKSDEELREEACKEFGCTSSMYCFAGRDKTVTPRMCLEARNILKAKIVERKIDEEKKHA